MKHPVPSENKIPEQHYPIAYAIVYAALETALLHIAESSENPDWAKDVHDKIQEKLHYYSELANISNNEKAQNVPDYLKQMNDGVEIGRSTVDAAFNAVMSRGLG